MAKLAQLMFSIIIKPIHTNALITIYYSRFIVIAHSALIPQISSTITGFAFINSIRIKLLPRVMAESKLITS